MEAERIESKNRSTGRPPKFNEPRRPITVTLPDRILRQLDAIDGDRAQAIVKVTETIVGRNQSSPKSVELVEISPGRAVLIVGPSASLRRIAWLQLVETAPGRNMLIIPSGTAVDSLEVEILDLLENEPPVDAEERALLVELRNQLGYLRREHRISKAEIIVFNTQNRRQPAQKTASPA